MRDQFASRQITAQLPAADVIEFSIPEKSRITLTILDENGKIVEVVLDAAHYDAGTHEIRFLTEKYATGIYYYRLAAIGSSGEIVDTKKLMITGSFR